MAAQKKSLSLVLRVLVIILAGELIFALPFHIARFFRPTFLQAFDLTNTQLGDIFAVYGVVAMLSYFPGGFIADRFAPHRLMSLSLCATALGGLFLWSGPDHTGLALLFGYWGATTILLFWAAMIKATRLAAGSTQQGLAFGLLDGGRGFIASLVASGALLLLSTAPQTTDGNFNSSAQALAALRPLVAYYTLLTLAVAAVAYYCIADPPADPAERRQVRNLRPPISILRNSLVWLQGGVVVCAYCGYKALDNYGIFVVQALHWSQLEAAQFTTWASYLRPPAAVLAGLLADRLCASRMTLGLFAGLGGAFVLMSWMSDGQPQVLLISITLLLTFIGVFALRGIYFALISESQIRMGATGTAVGVISVVGFTPDIFFAPVTGRILDAGDQGFAWYFMFLAVAMCLGCLCAYCLTQAMAARQAASQRGPSCESDSSGFVQ